MNRFMAGLVLGIMVTAGGAWATSDVLRARDYAPLSLDTSGSSGAVVVSSNRRHAITLEGDILIDAKCDGMDEALALLHELRRR